MNYKTKPIITVFCMAAMFLFAVSCTLIGNLLPNVIGEFQITLSRAGVVTVAQNFGGILALIFCGFLSDRFGKLRVILVIFSMMMLALCGCFIIHRFTGFIIAAMVIGLAASSLNMLISAYLSDLYPEKSHFYINMGGVFFGIGSVTAPVYLLAAARFKIGWRIDFGILGVISLIVLAFFLILLFRAPHPGHEKSGLSESLRLQSIFQNLKHPKLWLFASIGFLYMAHSSSFMGWIPTYLSQRFPDQTTMNNNIMAVYWAGILGSRLMMTFLSGKIKPKQYLIFGNALGGIVMLGSTFLQGTMLLLAFLLLGLITGAIFQVCLALTCQSFPHISGTASSVVALSASAGGTFCCWLVGFVAEQLGFFAALSIQAVVLLLIVPITIFGIRNPTNT